MTKRKRRYREKNANMFVAVQSGARAIHDFLKGWGTICKDCSILWDTWRPPTKREMERQKKKRLKLYKNGPPAILFPMIRKVFPELLASDIVSVQPMGTPGDPYLSFSPSYD